MFEVTSNQVIKIHKGDDSGTFPLYVNKGTKLNPVKYKFYPKLSVLNYPLDLDISIDSTIFSTKLPNDGFYKFEYKSNSIGQQVGWYYDGVLIDIAQYGILIVGNPSLGDIIEIAQFRKNISEVYLYVLNLNDCLNNWFMKKTFYSNGEVTTDFANCRIGTIFEERDTVDEDNNMILGFTSADTEHICPGEYCYQIKAKLYDVETDKFLIQTLTNRLPFYVIDGDSSIVW